MEDRRKILRFNYTGASGLDLVASWFLSEYRLARRIARKLLRPGGLYHGLDVQATRFVLQMPRASYEIVENDTITGEIVVKPCVGVAFGVGF